MPFDYSKYTSGTGAYVKFENVGDRVIGVVKEVREGRTFKGNPCPELVLEDESGEERIVTASQVMLRAALAERQPQPGDKVRIIYSGVGEAKPGQAPPKLFSVDVKPGPHQLQHPTVANDDPF